jgi:putative transposase
VAEETLETGIGEVAGETTYDNALAGSFNGLDKAEMTHKDGPWAGLDDVEFATLEYVDWFNHRRLHTELGMRPRAEFEAEYPHGEQAQMAASQ